MAINSLDQVAYSVIAITFSRPKLQSGRMPLLTALVSCCIISDDLVWLFAAENCFDNFPRHIGFYMLWSETIFWTAGG